MNDKKLNFLSGLSSATDIASTIFNPISTILTNKQNLKIAQGNRQFAYDMWKANNEYNTPLAQKQRLIDAGYNPNMFEASSNTSAAPAQTIDMPEMNAPQIDNQAGGRAFQNYLNKLTQRQQISAIKADISKANAESDYYNSMSTRMDMLMPLEAKKLSAEIEHTVAQKEFVQKNKDWIEKLNNKSIEWTDQQIKESRAHILLMASQAGLNKAQANYVAQQASYQIYFNKYMQEHGFTIDAAWQTKVGNLVTNLIDKISGLSGKSWLKLLAGDDEAPTPPGASGGVW